MISQRVAHVILVVGLQACTASQPPITAEADAPAAPASTASRSLYVGYPATPPPGQYRFVRVYDNGRAELREVYAVNGPGPWLTYEGVAEISPEPMREIFRAVDTTPAGSSPVDGRQACVLGNVSALGVAQRGCSDPDVAARVLAIVPSLGPPAIDPRCAERVCQIRFVRARRVGSHDLYGEIMQDVVLDVNGSFWCAAPAGRPSDPPNTLQISRGRMRGAEPRALLQWLGGDEVERLNPSGKASAVERITTVQIRGSQRDWTSLDASGAMTVTSRWAQTASRFPLACRP